MSRDSYEGTGTQPDSLVSRADKKNEGPLRNFFLQKSRNSRSVSGGGVGAEGMVIKGANWRSPETHLMIQTLKECLYCHI